MSVTYDIARRTFFGFRAIASSPVALGRRLMQVHHICMLSCMRTTISISESVLREARRRAAADGTTVSAVIEAALRAALAPKARRRPRAFKLVTFGGGGTQPGVDLDRTSMLLEGDDIRRHRPRGSP